MGKKLMKKLVRAQKMQHGLLMGNFPMVSRTNGLETL